MIQTANYKHNKDNQSIIHAIRLQLDNFERDLPALKEVATILELSLWKLKVNDHCLKEIANRRQKKTKTDDSSIRRQCRVTCRADVVIRHVMPYLISTGDVSFSLSPTMMTGASSHSDEESSGSW
jgi:hypothetical protein